MKIKHRLAHWLRKKRGGIFIYSDGRWNPCADSYATGTNGEAMKPYCAYTDDEDYFVDYRPNRMKLGKPVILRRAGIVIPTPKHINCRCASVYIDAADITKGPPDFITFTATSHEIK